ncbi:CoxG family protein [Peribacillus glennii]|uniref:SRPBCC family protein n=1 Tax=Peribacillus glennii TaxID=2303991 RepID=A0A372LH99_9BACI|nr:SRPBCC family protein [Peribacillus glennii]RFU65322.1 SRPBCC family protein [Peribacillus glennii]
MPEGLHQVKLPLSIENVWDFVSVMDNWAPLVPGYIAHEIISETESTWEFIGDLGLLKKKIKMKVEITKWEEPKKVTFDLIGLNEKFKGNGYFSGTQIDGQNTEMEGFLNITAYGATAALTNGLLKSFVPQTSTELTQAIAESLIGTNGRKKEIRLR